MISRIGSHFCSRSWHAQAVPYAFETDPVCDHFLSHLYTMSLEESYARSLEIQPKERKGGGKAKKKKKKGK